MGIRLHGGGMITTFPKSAFAAFSLIILLARPAPNQLHGLRYDFLPFIIPYYEVNMDDHRFRCKHVSAALPKKYLNYSPLPWWERARVRGRMPRPPPPQSSPIEGGGDVWRSHLNSILKIVTAINAAREASNFRIVDFLHITLSPSSLEFP